MKFLKKQKMTFLSSQLRNMSACCLLDIKIVNFNQKQTFSDFLNFDWTTFYGIFRQEAKLMLKYLFFQKYSKVS